MGCVVTWIQIDIELNIGIDDALRQAQFLASLVIGEERRDHQRWEEPHPYGWMLRGRELQ
jgi:hypothetical protein